MISELLDFDVVGTPAVGSGRQKVVLGYLKVYKIMNPDDIHILHEAIPKALTLLANINALFIVILLGKFFQRCYSKKL